MPLAVIKTGGKQYLVEPGKKIKVEKLLAKEGDSVEFSEVLLLEKKAASAKASAGAVNIGQPLVEGAKVTGKVLKQGKGEKVVIFKYKPKKRYKVKKGHRQPYTEVEISKF